MERPEIKKILSMCSEPFVLIKRNQDDFSYDIGGDIDIFARNAEQMTREIIHLSYGLVKDTFSIKISNYLGHYHVDYLQDGSLIVRIDIIDTLNIFNKTILENNEYAHLAIRLLEYAANPHKKKHLKYVYDKLNNLFKG